MAEIPKKTSAKSTKSRNNNKSARSNLENLKYEIASIVLSAICLLLILSLYTNSAGFLGSLINTLLIGTMGIGAYILPFFIILICVLMFFIKENAIDKPRVIMSICLFLIVISFVHIWNFEETIVYKNLWEYLKGSFTNASFKNGGLFGALFGNFLVKLIGKLGTSILLIASGIVLLILITGKSFFEFLRTLRDKAGDVVVQTQSKYFNDKDEENFHNDSKEFKTHTSKFQALRDKFLKTEEEEIQTREVFDYVLLESDETEGVEDDEIVNLINDNLKVSNKKDYTSIYDKKNTKINLTKPVKRTNYMEDLKIKKEDDIEIASKDKKENLVDEGNQEDDLEEDRDIIKTEKTGRSKKKDDEEYSIKINMANDDKKNKSRILKIDGIEEDIDINLSSNIEKKAKNIKTKKSKSSKTNIYKFPPINLLNENDEFMSLSSRTQIYENSRKLEDTLKSFGVEAKVIEVSKGPTVTRYEISPGSGVKVSKISGLVDDLALSLAADGIRIEAPVPGKSVVGIEIPNKEIRPVFVREVIEDSNFQTFPSKLAFALGQDIAGHTKIADISKMPHLLIAGATGSGKSVCINTLITSILYKATPEEVKLLLIDPKVVELSIYNGIPHLLIPVVTEPKNASSALNWAVNEMNDRYNLFAKASVRDLEGYNYYANLNNKNTLPQIVIIIDELADLMMVSPNEVEDSICRLAQMARAAGIHLIIATQRPSVNVITGLIKANIPSRLAFAVSSGTDSRTIIDSVGAEKLLGKGDMLFSPVGLGKPQRIQGSLITDKEVEKVVDFLKSDSKYEYDNKILEEITTSSKMNDLNEFDEFFTDSVDFIIEKNRASISMLQRRFKIGYNRAARIMEELETLGIVSTEDGSKTRKVLMDSQQWQNYKKSTTI